MPMPTADHRWSEDRPAPRPETIPAPPPCRPHSCTSSQRRGCGRAGLLKGGEAAGQVRRTGNRAVTRRHVITVQRYPATRSPCGAAASKPTSLRADGCFGHHAELALRSASATEESSAKWLVARLLRHACDRAQNRPCFPIGTRLPDHWSPAPLCADSGAPRAPLLPSASAPGAVGHPPARDEAGLSGRAGRRACFLRTSESRASVSAQYVRGLPSRNTDVRKPVDSGDGCSDAVPVGCGDSYGSQPRGGLRLLAAGA